MKVHIKAFCLLLSGLLIINIIFFSGIVYASSVGPSVGTPIPFGSLPSEQKDPFLQALKQFLHDFFGLYGEDEYIYVDPDTGEQFIGTEQEIYSYIQGKLDTDVSGIQDDYGNLLFYSFVHSIPLVSVISDLNSFAQNTLKSICGISESSYHKSGQGVIHGGSGRMRLDASDYSVALDDILKRTALGSLSIGIDLVNGVPQNITTIKQDSYISVFDDLGLEYTLAPSILDFQSSYIEESKPSTISSFTPFFITSDNKLYVFKADINTSSSAAFYFSAFDRYNVLGSANISLPSYYPFRVEFRFVENSGHLYFCFCCSSYSPAYNRLDYTQYTFGTPSVSNAPILFYDYSQGIGVPSSAEFSPSLYNNSLGSTGVYFECPTDKSNPLTDSDILSADIITFGCFQSNTVNIRFDSSMLNTAAQMLLASDDPISGGEDTVITSDLTDWQKGIYLLAQQLGISYSDMLQTGISLVIDDNGEMSLEDSNGILYNLSELVNQYDEIIGAVGNISGDLSELLEYLKSLNLEGLEGYIAAIEGTLNDLNERDKDNSAVLGDCLGSLTDLKEIFQDIDVSQINSSMKLIDKAMSNIISQQTAEEQFANQLSEFKISAFKLYDQCKYFLENLFNYGDRNYPPNFDFYYDSNGDGEAEIYRLIDLSFLENTLTNDNMVDKSWWSIPIKIIDLIRYVIAIVCYGLFVMRLIKRLPTFYGSGPMFLS